MDNVRGVRVTTAIRPLWEEVSSVRLVVCSRCYSLWATTKWKTVTADLYCQQMRRVAEKIRQFAVEMSSRDRPLLLHDIAKPHTASQTKSTLEALGFDVLPHPQYSPDLSPSDYYLFRSMEHSLREQTLEDRGHIEKWLSDFFDSKSLSFHEKGIFPLEERW